MNDRQQTGQSRTALSGSVAPSRPDRDSMTARTQGWEGRTVTASGAGRPVRRMTTGHMDARRLAMLSDVRDLYPEH